MDGTVEGNNTLGNGSGGVRDDDSVDVARSVGVGSVPTPEPGTDELDDLRAVLMADGPAGGAGSSVDAQASLGHGASVPSRRLEAESDATESQEDVPVTITARGLQGLMRRLLLGRGMRDGRGTWSVGVAAPSSEGRGSDDGAGAGDGVGAGAAGDTVRGRARGHSQLFNIPEAEAADDPIPPQAGTPMTMPDASTQTFMRELLLSALLAQRGQGRMRSNGSSMANEASASASRPRQGAARDGAGGGGGARVGATPSML